MVLCRTYRTLGPKVGPFGVGWRQVYEHVVPAVSAGPALMITPESLRPRFAKQPDESFATLEIPPTGGLGPPRMATTPGLRFKDGTSGGFNDNGWIIGATDRTGNALRIQRDSRSQ